MIYLDNNATTRPLPEVLEAMLPFYQELWGNPSSLHQFGAQITAHIEQSRNDIATLIGAQRPGEIIFTSGGTESNNLALRGALATQPTRRHLLTTAVEHPSVLAVAHQMGKEGMNITHLGVNANGLLDLYTLEAALTPDTGLVSIMWANNETGVIFPIEAVGKICKSRGVPLHVDATQAVGKIPIDLQRLPGISLLSLSGHKFHAPKGIGALFIRRGTKLFPQQLGGGQERSLRGGTQNVAGIVGLGKGAAIARTRLQNNIWKTIAQLRDHFETTLRQKFNFVRINGDYSDRPSPRLPHTSSISFEGCEAETICLLLSEEEIACSTGSACSAGSLEPSHVLKAMGISTKLARGTVRFSMSCETTKEDIEKTIQVLGKIIPRLRST